MNISPISSYPDAEAPLVRELQTAAKSETSIEFKAHGPNFTAIVISEDGNITKHVKPEIKCSVSEIKKIKSEIDRFQRAVEKKEIELKTLREREDYNGITTAAGYRREYEERVKNLTLRLEGLKKKIPGEIQISIENVKKFINLLDAEKSAAEELISQAEKMKSEYEKA